MRVGVWDTGIGIAPEDQGKVFGEFAQVETALTRQYAGTGLGLTLVKRYVEQHGGQVWVESEVGQGSTFFFTLPVAVQSPKAIPTPEAVTNGTTDILLMDSDGSGR